MAIVNSMGEAGVVISVDTAKSLEIGVCETCRVNLISIAIRITDLDTDEFPTLTYALCFACWPEFFNTLTTTLTTTSPRDYFICIGEI